ncbi:LacI family transcriptional regulator [Arthrobacter sp. E918]|uniref:LacI family transcriptional regulator n=1 Tax=Arthrobacter mobilis TaxID=2724944 RepID=A0A7X6HEI8_9MICC|nr:LacI family transcriptional regulator [Arthrobacter mobilis]
MAARAGVSTATVSRVLTGTAPVNEELAERVRTAAAELSYKPNAAARGLVLGTMRSLGILMPDMSNPYFFEVVDEINRAGAAQAFRTLVASSYGDPDAELETAKDLLPQVDGLFLLSSRIPVEGLRTLARAEVPVVLVNRIEVGVDLPMVAVDVFSVTMELCGQLLRQGHRKAVYLSGSPDSWQNRERWRAICTAAAMGLETECVQTDGTIESAYQAVDQALKHQPTALLAFNDLAAIGAVSRLRDLGLEVPASVSVTGFDDIPLARHTEPKLTTILSPTAELGRTAWNRMHALLQGIPSPAAQMLPAHLVIRDSLGPAKPIQ